MNLAHDLLLLTFNLSQLHVKEKIISLFVEGMQEIFNPVKFEYSEEKREETDTTLDIRTNRSYFGVINFEIPVSFSKNDIILFRNSVQMLAVILERLEFEKNIEKERDKYEKIYNEKLDELGQNVKELEQAKSASINLIEDLTSEIHKREKAEIALRESEQKFRRIFEEGKFCMATVDKGFKFIQVNDAFCKMIGYPENELLQMTFPQITHPDHLANDVDSVKKLYSNEIHVYQTEKKYIEKNGNIIWGSVNISALRDEENRFISFLVMIDDITRKKQVEIDLVESEQKFRNLFEHSPVGKSMTGIDGTINVNKSFCSILGYTEKDLKEKNWKEISHPDDISLNENFVKSLLERKIDSAKFEKRYLHKNGSVIYTEVSTYLQRDIKDNPLYFITTINDITERKLLENEKFRLINILDKSLNEIYVFDSETLLFKYVNQGALKNIGYTFEEMGQMTPLNIKPLFAEKDFRKMVKPLLRDEKAVICFETMHRRKNGTDYPVEIYLQLHQEDGQKLFFAVINDITNRRIAEQELKESEGKYRTLIEVSMDAIFINQDNKITYINEAGVRLLGAKKAEQIIGKSPYDIFHPDYHQNISDRIERMLLHSTPVDLIEEKVVRLDGTFVDVEVAATPFILRNEQAIQVILRNITERKKAQAEIKQLNDDLEKRVIIRTIQLEEAVKELEAFSYSVSHDLRAPLRAIHSFTSILREDYEKVLDEEGKRICTIIENSSVHMGKLIDDLLSFSRIGRTELKSSKIDMTQMVKSLILEISDSSSVSSIDFKIAKLPAAYGDSATIQQVLVNLISNAVKYSSKAEHPVIELGFEKSENETIYFIKDNGVGFDMKYSDKLFGVFQRLHSNKEFEGNGVGLAIVQRIIHRHGGRVWAEGVVGKGATFFFTLPEKDERHPDSYRKLKDKSENEVIK